LTVEHPNEFRGECIAITDPGISPRLHWGYQEKKSRYPSYQIAEPEKALLDWIYLKLQDGVEPALDEFDFSSLNRSRLVEYAERFPRTVLKRLLPILLTEAFAAQTAPSPRNVFRCSLTFRRRSNIRASSRAEPFCQNRLTAAKSGIASITPFPENCDAIFAWGPLSLLAGNHQI
jgi:hypothetical protein